ncbi:Methyltransferase [Hexamita inflata]|uniref:Methyltransferase n=1 Tax=Hexamita inflata TaxID=28002 RepID=A0AA86TQW0_9EUKA|nr:Methyltransferase [Hexamita inflata]
MNQNHSLFVNTPRNWSEYYGKISVFREYYLRVNDLSDILKPMITEQSEVLILGCGTSLLGFELSANVTQIDFCKPVIDHMQLKEQKSEYLHMDARALRFPDCTFNLVLVKALFEFQDDIQSICQIIIESHRVLTKNGILLVISQINEEFMSDSLDIVKWQKVKTLRTPVNNCCQNGKEERSDVQIFVCFK